jgi:hypothetical protein
LSPVIGEDARTIAEKELILIGYERSENVRSGDFGKFTAGRLPKDYAIYSKQFSDGRARFTIDCLMYEDNGRLNIESCSESTGVNAGDERHLDEINNVREALGTHMRVKTIW